MSIYRKKSAVINSQVRISNELSQVFVPNNNNLGISINTTIFPVNSTNTIATNNVIDNMPKQYYVSLISSTTGSQTINTSTNLLYDISNDNLQLNKLSTTNPPSCSATPVNSNDLINRAYLNSFVGDYTQGWIRDDWITGGVNGSLNWVITNRNNPSDATILLSSDASGHVGIIRLLRTTTFTSLQSNTSIRLNSNQNLCVRFLVRPFSNNSTSYNNVRLSLSEYKGYVDYYNIPANYANMACWSFETYAVNSGSENTKWGCLVNTGVQDASYNYGLSENSLRNKWVLFEIELNNRKPSFYITVVGETNRTLVYQETTKTISNTVMLIPQIIIINGSVASTTSVDVDYIDIKYTNMSRT